MRSVGHFLFTATAFVCLRPVIETAEPEAVQEPPVSGCSLPRGSPGFLPTQSILHLTAQHDESKSY